MKPFHENPDGSKDMFLKKKLTLEDFQRSKNELYFYHKKYYKNIFMRYADVLKAR